MRHAHAGRKLNRTQSHRKAMFRNMVTSLIDRDKIETTETKAKEIQALVERMITLGKRGDLHARRQALAVIRKKEVVKKLFDEIAPRYQNRNGGYTRIIKTGIRKGDAARLAIIELIREEASPPAKSKKPAEAKSPKKKKQAESKT
jgi:large subunit ribosomal protein L17